MSVPLSHPDTASQATHYTVVSLTPQLAGRNRLTCAFRPILAIPHVLLVGAPIAVGISLSGNMLEGPNGSWGGGTGVLGLVAAVAALIAWFAILFTGQYPRGLWNLGTMYLRWRVRAVAYMALLRDEYPPFGDAEYPASVVVLAPDGPRNRLTTAFRILLLIPQFIVLWVLSVVWLFTTIAAWFAILFTGRLPQPLADYGVAMVRWGARVESYLLLLHDEYPPFTMEA